MKLTPQEKAQEINNDFGQPETPGGVPKPGPINYRGAFAEIGAGQEVARLFFEAKGSSKTVIKTMSAYGKGCSNAIYDKAPYISELRLSQMFAHDYPLLVTRSLTPDEISPGQVLRYFMFANTVVTSRDGWAGVRVQIDGNQLDPDRSHFAHEYRVHFEILAKDKIAQINIAGALGVNLIHAALLHGSEKTITNEEFVSALMDSIEKTDLRIDTIAVEKKYARVDSSSRDKMSMTIEPVESEAYGKISRDMCIELVKTEAVHCTSFLKSHSAAMPSYYAIEREKYLVVTRSACNTEELRLETEMLRVAQNALAKELTADFKKEVVAADIVTAIHLPILGLVPQEEAHFEQFVYIDRDREPEKIRKPRVALIKGASTTGISERIERIVKIGHIALLSEFSASSELIKYVRSRTRLATLPPGNVRTVALVLRADQFVEMLVNIETRFKDRDPMEILGSIVRRHTRIYIYPCTFEMLLNAKTRYGTALKDSIDPSFLALHAKFPARRATVAHLKVHLKDVYRSLIGYLDSEGTGCIQDLDDFSEEYVRMPSASGN